MKPNTKELAFLDLAYNKFYDLYEELMDDLFWNKDCYYRFNKIKTIFSVYGELLNYEPLKYIIKVIKIKRPPNEAKIASELFKCIRNILAHFPFFDSWEEVFFNYNLINWFKEGMSVDKFLKNNENTGEIKYRFWNYEKKIMTYVTITLPNNYSFNNDIFLKDIISEKDGVLFSIILMKQVLDTQVIEIE